MTTTRATTTTTTGVSEPTVSGAKETSDWRRVLRDSGNAQVGATGSSSTLEQCIQLSKANGTISTQTASTSSVSSEDSDRPTVVQIFHPRSDASSINPTVGETKRPQPSDKAKRMAMLGTSDLETTNSSSSSSYKRYKNSPFGLRNHFITMPEPNYEHELVTGVDNNLETFQRRERATKLRQIEQSHRSPRSGFKQHHQHHPIDYQDLSALQSETSLLSSGPSSPSHWLDYQQHDEHHPQRPLTSQPTVAVINGRHGLSKSGQYLTPAGDAGLDASQCNSKMSSGHPCDDLIDQMATNSKLTSDSHFNKQIGGGKFASNAPPISRQSLASDASAINGLQQMAGDHYLDSGSLLIRFSSIMYAAFLVILGCILHIAELRQKSKNSSDHIYTTIVALIGIIWLLFLQADLQKYKRYASRYILIESLVDDQNRLAHDRKNRTLMGHSSRLSSASSSSSSSTESSNTSLVNDRISLNTEVIFKKTAYKMYQQQAATLDKQSAKNRGPGLYGIRSVSPNHQTRINYHHNQPDTSELDQHDIRATLCCDTQLVPAYKFLHGKMGANFYLKCGMAAFCFGHVIHEGLRFGQQLYFFGSSNGQCRDLAALVAHLVTPLYSFYQLFMMFKYSNLVINRHKVLARFGLMHIVGTSISFWFRTILEEAFEDFIHKMDYFRAQNKQLLPPSMRNLDLLFGGGVGSGSTSGLKHQQSPQGQQFGGLSGQAIGGNSSLRLINLLLNSSSVVANNENNSSNTNNNMSSLAQSALWALMSSPMSATITPQLVSNLPESYACAHNTLLTTKSMNALPYLYPFTIEYNLLLAATFLSLYFNIGKIGPETNTNCQTKTTTSSGNPTIGAGRVHSKIYSNLKKSTNNSLASNQGSSSNLSFIASSSNHELSDNSSTSPNQINHLAINEELIDESQHYQQQQRQRTAMVSGSSSLNHHGKYLAEYKSNFVVNADCHSANKGLFCGFFVLLVTLVTIVIFFVTINKPSHLQLGIKINLIQETTLTGLLLIVTLVGFKQIVKLNRNSYLNNKVTTDDVLMLIPLPFFFIHSLLAFRAETATLYSSSHGTNGNNPSNNNNNNHQINIIGSSSNNNNLLIDGNNLNSLATNENNRQRAALAVAKLLENPTTAQRIQLIGSNQFDRLQQPIILFETTTNIDNPNRTQANLNKQQNLITSGSTRQLNGLLIGQVIDRGDPRMGHDRFANETMPKFFTTNNRAKQKSGDKLNTSSTNNLKNSAQIEAEQKIDHFKLLTIALNVAVLVEVLIQTNFIIDGLRRCSESRYLRFKKPGRELITFAIILNIAYWIVATFETKSVEQYKTEMEYYGPLPYMFISHTTLPVMLFYRYHSSVCLAEIWNRAYKPSKRR